ncbi:2-dehydropantoate 2-reductase [Herbaspirillum sp. RTI4]|uniref:2-dehydropantoate 2-reductase n=1 Tax=Herbaspirillum sp. RTI4 TaxID=3048640 RepID=UPI002AB5451B|nr:2-dehydropantoate 2-reductase [Herbaspirillum sp. RTI4]MDY7579972.1 2-dehydropantoate 2-reductase [Herbaspirillum sp. RTI4]MEA9982884.1 2-dehydropantoate 2-reductase [Herbaspirillum sp. RTI4]
MKISIYGMGAIGGLFAARLAEHGHEVSAVARGATLLALQQHGVRVVGPDGTRNFAVRAEADPALLGPQDLIILAVKGPALAAVASTIAPLIGPHTVIINAMNGVPWWFFEPAHLPYSGTRLNSIDADGALSRVMPVAQILGCVVHLSSSCPEPGLIKTGFGNTLILGEPGGGISARLSEIAKTLSAAGFDVEETANIRQQIWYKLWGNMTMNPVSAITGATCDLILADPLVSQFCLNVMQEAALIGAKIACPIQQSGEDRNAITRSMGAFKTSMLQDAEAGKALEIDALVGVVREIGQMVGVATPAIDSLLGLARLFGRTHGLYPAAIQR